MANPLETAHRPSPLKLVPDPREIRIHFASRAALLEGFALAQKESWVEDCHVHLSRRELVIRMAGGASIQPRRATPTRRHAPETLASAGCEA
jgi:hypothetical protein